MSEPLRVTLGIITMVGGWTLVVYAGYLCYVALPTEHAARHVLTRATLAGGGILLVLLATWVLR